MILFQYGDDLFPTVCDNIISVVKSPDQKFFVSSYRLLFSFIYRKRPGLVRIKGTQLHLALQQHGKNHCLGCRKHNILNDRIQLFYTAVIGSFKRFENRCYGSFKVDTDREYPVGNYIFIMHIIASKAS